MMNEKGWTLHREFESFYLPDFERVMRSSSYDDFDEEDLDALIFDAESRGWQQWRSGCYAHVLRHPQIEGVLLKIYQPGHHNYLYGSDEHTSEEHLIIQKLEDDRVMKLYGHHRYGVLVEEVQGLSIAQLTDTDEEILPYLPEIIDFIRTSVSKGVVPFDLHAANLFVSEGRVRFIDVGCYQFIQHFIDTYHGDLAPLQSAIYGALERLIEDEAVRQHLIHQYSDGSTEAAWADIDPSVPRHVIPYFNRLRERGLFLEHIDWRDVVDHLCDYVVELGWTYLASGSYARVFQHADCPDVLLKIYSEDHHYDLYDGDYPTIDEVIVSKRLGDDPRCMKVLGHHEYGVFITRMAGTKATEFHNMNAYVDQLFDYISSCIAKGVVPLDLNPTNVLVHEGQLRFIDFGHYQLLEDFRPAEYAEEDPFVYAVDKMTECLEIDEEYMDPEHTIRAS